MGFFQKLSHALIHRKISHLDLVRFCSSKIQKQDDKIGAFLSLDILSAESLAKQIDTEPHKTNVVAGIPISIKDLICTKKFPTTAGSRILEDYKSPFDATVIEKINHAHMPILGKVNLDEFGMGSSNEHSAYKITKNPWNISYVPGGSSGGSAASIAGGMSPLSLGTDTGGSIRQPAAFCGITGLKPTYGRVSRWGLLAYASSLDQIGPMGVDAQSCAALMDVISGYDSNDATSHPQNPENFYQQTITAEEQKLYPKKMGWVPEFLEGLQGTEVFDTFVETKRHFESLGIQFVELNFKSLPYSLATYYILSTSEAASNLSKYDGIHVGSKKVVPHDAQQLESLISKTRSLGFGEEVKTRVLLGSYALSSGYYDAFYQRAAKVRRWIFNEFTEEFKKCQAILAPCTPTEPFKIGEKINDPLSMYKSDIFTIPVNLAGLPAIAFPTKLSKNQLPLGLQLIGPRWSESTLLNTVTLFQKTCPETVLCNKIWMNGLGL